jgi:hypothetical protein
MARKGEPPTDYVEYSSNTKTPTKTAAKAKNAKAKHAKAKPAKAKPAKAGSAIARNATAKKTAGAIHAARKKSKIKVATR